MEVSFMANLYFEVLKTILSDVIAAAIAAKRIAGHLAEAAAETRPTAPSRSVAAPSAAATTNTILAVLQAFPRLGKFYVIKGIAACTKAMIHQLLLL